MTEIPDRYYILREDMSLFGVHCVLIRSKFETFSLQLSEFLFQITV